MKLYPMLLSPALKPVIWGGNEIFNEFGKGTKDKIIGESWELSVRDDLKSVIMNGEYKGKTVTELFKEDKFSFIGKKEGEFPWLIKFIDAKDRLSVQVHPDDSYAKSHGDGSGKTEMWHILKAEPGASLVIGFNKDTTPEEIKKTAQNGEIEKMLNLVPVKKGDTFFIKSGTVHAIGKGILLLEIQQNSDATYRLYDFMRRDKDGNLRELHIDKGADVSNTEKTSPNADKTVILSNGDELLAECEYFRVLKVSDSERTLNGLSSVICLDGEIELDGITMKKGDTVLIPYSVRDVFVKVRGSGVIVSDRV